MTLIQEVMFCYLLFSHFQAIKPVNLCTYFIRHLMQLLYIHRERRIALTRRKICVNKMTQGGCRVADTS